MQKQIKIEDLSFVKLTNNKREFWVSNQTNEFLSSVEFGRKQATEYLQYLATEDAAPILASIVRDLALKTKTDDLDSGQVIGFFATLESVIRASIKNYPEND